MKKTFYILSWALLALTAVSFSMGYLDPITMIFLSLIAVSLVYALALWSTVSNTP
jgi:hypothetical protein